jgi:hypothetical protein
MPVFLLLSGILTKVGEKKIQIAAARAAQMAEYPYALFYHNKIICGMSV